MRFAFVFLVAAILALPSHAAADARPTTDVLVSSVSGSVSDSNPSYAGSQSDAPSATTPSVPLWPDLAMPSKGNVRALAVLVDFPGTPLRTPVEDARALLFGDGAVAPQGQWPGYPRYPYESLRNYYRRSSYGQLSITGDVVCYTAKYPRSHYGDWDLNDEVLDALDARGTDFGAYDSDEDGIVDYILYLYAGESNWENHAFFNHAGAGTNGSDRSFDGKKIGAWVYQSDRDWWSKVFIHETGHALGVPDYYDYRPSWVNGGTGPDGGLGGLDMMDYNHGDHNVVTKYLLGWVTPRIAKCGDQIMELSSSSTAGDAIILCPDFDPSKPYREFFIAEYRTPEANNDNAYDKSFGSLPSWWSSPRSGVFVWHVDLSREQQTYLFDNHRSEHKFLRLMEADGSEHIENRSFPLSSPQDYWQADPGDLFVPGSTFGPATSPSSHFYGGRPSGIQFSVSQFQGSKASISLSVQDVVPPLTSAHGVPAADLGGQASCVGTATISLSATDGTGGSGVAHTYYRVDGGTASEGTTAVVSTPGSHALQFWSVDVAGNTESPTTISFDVVAPPVVRVRPSLGGPVGAATMYRTKSYIVRGSLRPRHLAGTYPVRVHMERYVAGRWRTYGYVRARVSDYSGYSRYSASVRLPREGRWRLRAYAPADARHLAAWSSTCLYVRAR